MCNLYEIEKKLFNEYDLYFSEAEHIILEDFLRAFLIFYNTCGGRAITKLWCNDKQFDRMKYPNILMGRTSDKIKNRPKIRFLLN